MQRLLAPLATEHFIRDYWEKAPCLIKGQGSRGDRRFDLPSIQDIDSMISLTHPRPVEGEVRLVKTENSEIVNRPVTENPDGTGNIYSIYRAYLDGFTIIINSVDRRSRQIAELSRALRLSLGHDVGVNLYYTPPRAQGFLPHFDTHDVFVHQLHGSKRWRIFKPDKELPLTESKSELEPGSVGVPLAQYQLEVGDTLYIPRGYIHDAVTSDTASMHLTIGVYATRWAHLLHDLVELASEQDVSLRRGLPIKFSSQACASALAARLQALAETLGQPDRCAQAVQRRLDRVLSTGNPVPDGHFASLEKATLIDLGTRIARRKNLACRVSVTDREATINFSGNSVSGPAPLAPAFQFISQAEQFAVRDLPDDLSDDSKITLTKRLINEGLLRVAAPENSMKGDQRWPLKNPKLPPRQARRKRSPRAMSGGVKTSGAP